jgi:hypothetical protein
MALLITLYNFLHYPVISSILCQNILLNTLFSNTVYYVHDMRFGAV